MKLSKPITFLLVLTPGVVWGADVDSILNKALEIIDLLLPITFALALLFFFWGLALFILRSGKEKEVGKGIMIWGVIALFVMVSIFGIVAWLQTSLEIDNNDNVNIGIPQFCGTGGSC